MKTRSIKKLLTILLESEELFESEDCSGLCRLVTNLYKIHIITNKERHSLLDYIANNRPKEDVCYDASQMYSAWYWPFYEWLPRKAWLQYRIKKHRS